MMADKQLSARGAATYRKTKTFIERWLKYRDAGDRRDGARRGAVRTQTEKCQLIIFVTLMRCVVVRGVVPKPVGERLASLRQ